ncbi:hypothetical protein IID20_01955 [Patescibacteria group bacterium]|nr:hypothetical protein [Patescibacteria group bacterium]
MFERYENILVIFLIIPIFLGLIFSLFLFIENSQAQDAVQTSVSVIALTFSIDLSNVDLGNVTPGSPVTATNTLTVTTNNATGFNIKIKRDDSDTTMDLDSDATVNFPDRLSWDPAGDGNASIWLASDREFGFRVRQTGTDEDNYNATWWGSDDTDANAKLAGFPNISKTIVNRITNPLGETDSVVIYKLDSLNSQRTGIYSGSITYSAIVNL